MRKVLVDVKGDGSCFFRALYGAMLFGSQTMNIKKFFEQFACDSTKRITSDLIPHTNKKKLENKNQEDEWTRCIRKYLADVIEGVAITYDTSNELQELQHCMNYVISNKINSIVKNSHDILMDLKIKHFESERNGKYDPQYFNTYTQILTGFPTDFVDALRPGLPNELNEFKKIMADHMRGIRNYVGEYDVDIVKKLLSLFGIKLNIQSVRANDVDDEGKINKLLNNNSIFPARPEEDTLYLLNIGENHYNFVYYDKDTTNTSEIMAAAASNYTGGKKNKKKIHNYKRMENKKLYMIHTSKKDNKKYIIKNKKKKFIKSMTKPKANKHK